MIPTRSTPTGPKPDDTASLYHSENEKRQR